MQKSLLTLGISYLLFKAFGKVGDNIAGKLIFGDLAINDVDIYIYGAVLEMTLPIKNNNEVSLPFDGLDGFLEYKNMNFASVKVLESVVIKGHEISVVQIKSTVYWTTVLSLGSAILAEIKALIGKKSFNGEVYLKGVAFSGQLKYNLNNRIM